MTPLETKLAEALRWCERVLDKEHPAAIKAREALAEYEREKAGRATTCFRCGIDPRAQACPKGPMETFNCPHGGRP